MATAGVNRMMLWTDLEGRTLNDCWQLQRLVRPEGRMAWFAGTGVDGRPAMFSLTEALNDEEELLERLKAAAAIRHPNVVEIRDSQLAWVEDTPVVVAEMEPTEENLGDVLRERALNAEEGRMVMDALLAGLAAIHRKKLMHGRMEAGSVVAMGETIKLRSDCLHEPGPTGFADDLRGFGRILVQSMTRRIPSNENDPVLQLLPEPMARAARRALSGTASVEEVAALAGTRLALVPEYTVAPKENRPAPESKLVAKAEPERIPEPAATEPDRNVPGVKTDVETAAASKLAANNLVTDKSVTDKSATDKPVTEKSAARVLPMKATEVPVTAAPHAVPPVPDPVLPRSPLLTEEDDPEWDRRRSAPYVIGAAVVLVLVTIFVLYGMLHRSAPKTAATPQSQSTAAPSPIPAAAAPAAAVGAQKLSPQASSAGTAAAGPGWRVIAYTYDRQAQAEQKANELSGRYPQLQPSVFSPKGRSPYLVTLGGAMSSQADAKAFREKAVHLGLPRDTYVQKFR